MNVWGYLATRTPAAIDHAIAALTIGVPLAVLIRAWEKLGDEDKDQT